MRSRDPLLPSHPLALLAATALAGSLVMTPDVARADEVDFMAPQATLQTTPPSVLYTAEADQAFPIRAHVTDETGTASVTFEMENPYYSSRIETALTLVEGTPTDGIWAGTVEIPRRTSPLLWNYGFATADVNGSGNDHVVGPCRCSPTPATNPP